MRDPSEWTFSELCLLRAIEAEVPLSDSVVAKLTTRQLEKRHEVVNNTFLPGYFVDGVELYNGALALCVSFLFLSSSRFFSSSNLSLFRFLLSLTLAISRNSHPLLFR